MKSFWIEKADCTGCGMCADVCPTKAIRIVEDESGFYYPSISIQCIDCDMCETYCRKRLDIKKESYKSPVVYAAWSNDIKLRFSSTSGGVFSELAKNIINDGGYVVGAEYGENNLVKHVLVTEQNQLYRIKQSKYVQSFSEGIYTCVKTTLRKGKTVLFCGTPCQVSALYAFLGQDYPNLYTASFICKGVNSPKAFRAWLSEIEKKHKLKISRVWFKYKEDGWKMSPKCTRLDFENNKYLVLKQDENLFMYGYLNHNLFIRPSCGRCHFKGSNIYSDITLADYWGIEKKLDDDKGTSLVAINDQKGEMLFEKAKKRLVVHMQTKNAFAHNPSYLQSVNISPQLKKFMADLDRLDFSKAIKKHTSKKSLFEIIRKIKRRLA